LLTLTRLFVRWDLDASDAALDSVAALLFHAGETARPHIEIGKTGVSASAEHGTVIGAVEIGAHLADVLTVVIGYGSFWAAVEVIRSQARSAGEFIRVRLKQESPLTSSAIATTRITTGHLTSLERLHRETSEGSLTPSDAVHKAMGILDRAGEKLTTGIVENLESAFGASHRPEARLADYHAPGPQEASFGQRAPDVLEWGVVPEVRLPRRRAKRRGVRIYREPGSSERHKEEY
jgi:hypothetical protein